MSKKLRIKKIYDIIIVGGGLSGVCAAISAARHGAKTALIQNRPVLGGNASSEIRMHICGADYHATKPDVRETGIIEEILLENKRRNPQQSFSIFDTVLWEKVKFQEGLDLFLNTHMNEAIVEDGGIKKIYADQLTTEKLFEFEAKIYVDSTGDATLAKYAGAEYMSGREGQEVFGEQYAPRISDRYTMGNTLLFKTVDTGKPVSFEKPYWANTYNEEDLKYRNHEEITSGYWWIELGGVSEDIITDGETLRDELLKSVYGLWDHIKNGGEHGADNLALDWIGFLPGKRESRRVVGDYILKEQDVLSNRVFDDAVAYGGWPMDMHCLDGLKATNEEPTDFIVFDGVYSIPYRSLYSKDIANLMMGGRVISASHMAFGSTRVMATCSVIGQAVGTAAALAIKKNITPKSVNHHIKELQQTLLKDDCYIPQFKNEDIKDMARMAKVSCSSSIEGYECENIINGVTRREKAESNLWVSDSIKENGEWISLKFDQPIAPKELQITFDSNLLKELMPTLSDTHKRHQVVGLPHELIKDYTIEYIRNNEVIRGERIVDNYLRHRRHRIQDVICDEIKIDALSTYGVENARIYEIRVY